jgi:hypothetical protein
MGIKQAHINFMLKYSCTNGNCHVIFRWTRTCPKTGRVIRSKRPMPIPIGCDCGKNLNNLQII